MKKQILILTLFTLALIFAGTKSYGQLVYKDYVGGTNCTTALPIACVTAGSAGHLNPTPGQNYNYEISSDPATVDGVLWFVTDETDVIYVNASDVVTIQPSRDPRDGTGAYIALAENGVYNTVGNTTKDIDISWQNFNGSTNDVLLVAYVIGASGCSDNVEVWKIEPTFAFTLDILSMADDGTLGTTIAPIWECVSPVESAIYDGTANLGMNYGQNWVFFSVNAANFVGSWKPTMTASSSNGGTIGDVQWAYASEAVLNDGSGAANGTWNNSGVPVKTTATDSIVGTGGECIIVRVQVSHLAIEEPTATNTATVTLTIDGIMRDAADDVYTNSALADLDNSLVVDGPCQQGVSLDNGEYTLTARPLITEVSPTTILGPFEIKN